MLEKLGDVLIRTFEDIEQRYNHKGEIFGVPSGFTDLDNRTDGWQKKTLYILGGRPSLGKSALIKDFFFNAAQRGFKPHLINIEDNNISTTKRALSGKTGIQMYKLSTGFLSREDFNIISAEISSLGSQEAFFDEIRCQASEVSESIREAATEGSKVVFIDYLQMIRYDLGGTGNRYEKIGEITKNIKILTKELDIPIICTATLNRDLEKRENKRPGLSDLRESGDIEYDADVVMFLHRPGVYDIEIDESDTELIIAKGRNIGTGIVKLRYDPKTVSFSSA